jgi:hypothetical protein
LYDWYPFDEIRTYLYHDRDYYETWTASSPISSMECHINGQFGQEPALLADAASNPFGGDNCVPDPLGGVRCCDDLDYCHDEGCTDGLHSCATYDDFGNLMTMSHDIEEQGSAGYVANYDCWCPPEPFVGPCDTDHGGCDPLVTCKPDSGKPKCGACPDGYDDIHGDGTKCVDVDECDTGNGGCDEVCRNFPGTYACGCKFGATLRDDDRTCEREPVDRLDIGTDDA